LKSRTVAIGLSIGLLFLGSIAIYQQVLLLSPARNGTPVTTTTTTTVTNTITSTSASTAVTNLTTTIGNQATASTTNDTLGLEIILSLNTTRVNSGSSVNITLTVRNLLPRTLDLPTSAEDWPLTALAVGGDSYGYCVGVFPFDMEIFAGHYTESNITLGAPINVDVKDAILSCKIPVPSYDSFGPLSTGAYLRDVTSGYYVNGQSYMFYPGPYTVVAGDRWGQMVILNFVVVGQAAP
jgi:hypothetical protein